MLPKTVCSLPIQKAWPVQRISEVFILFGFTTLCPTLAYCSEKMKKYWGMIGSPFFYRPKMQKTASNTLKSLINQEAYSAKKFHIPQNVPH
ncbi:hypothetical protein ACEVG1_16450 [Parapedobacter sp. 2B3]